MVEKVYDVVVVGAGVEGSSTALNLATRGLDVALIEQFQLGHTRGSSHGGSRIIRRSYDEPIYAEMMIEAYKLWENIEREAGVQLYYQTGGTFFGHKDSTALNCIVDNLKKLGLDHEVLSAQEANNRFKYFQLPSDFICVVDKAAGLLDSVKSVRALQSLFTKHGGKIFDCCQVQKVQPGDVIAVETNKGTFSTKQLVVTAGPWSSKLLEPLGVTLPLRVIKVDVPYWRVECLDICTVGNPLRTMGVFSHSLDKTISCYGIPSYEYPGLIKIAHHQGAEVDPDDRDANAFPQSLEEVSEIIATYFKGVSTTPSIVETCMYTETPDNNFFLDCHPKYRNIVIGAGFSGHGFKLAPVVGKVLAELALGLPPSYSMETFQLTRPMH